MAATWIKALHRSGGSIAAALDRTTDYIANPDKTNGGELIDSFECDPFTAQSEFRLSKRQYEQKTGRDQGKNDVIAYHIRMSFKPGEVTAEQALELGMELASRWTKNKHQFIVAAHTNTNNPHVHIVYNSVNLNCDRKYQDFKRSAIALRRLSDHICLEKGLTVIEKPGLSRGWNRTRHLGADKPLSVRGQLRCLMDSVLPDCKDFDGFIAALKAAGVEIKHGKQLAFRPPGSKKFSRQDTLGDDYSISAIIERISGKRVASPREETVAPLMTRSAPSLFIDIQAKIQEGKGGGYENWARIFNIKQMAKTLVFLRENGLDNYDDLVEKSAAASAEYKSRLCRIKEIEKRLGEISELQKHIGTYGKTREVYKQYLNAKNRADFFEEHRADITLCRAAKKHFDDAGYGRDKRLPTISSLKQEYAVLLAEKRELYSGYRLAKSNMIELLTAKSNTDKILGVDSWTLGRDTSRAGNRRDTRGR